MPPAFPTGYRGAAAPAVPSSAEAWRWRPDKNARRSASAARASQAPAPIALSASTRRRPQGRSPARLSVQYRELRSKQPIRQDSRAAFSYCRERAKRHWRYYTQAVAQGPGGRCEDRELHRPWLRQDRPTTKGNVCPEALPKASGKYLRRLR